MHCTDVVLACAGFYVLVVLSAALIDVDLDHVANELITSIQQVNSLLLPWIWSLGNALNS